MAQISQNILSTIGHTPLVRLQRILPHSSAVILAKVESFNPSLSVKDRTALQMIEDAEERGTIRPGVTTIIEPTSGNTGVGLAMIAAVKGYKCIVVMPDSMSVERRVTMAAYGCEIVLTPGKAGMSGAIKKALSLQKTMDNVWIPQQFENPSNIKVHEKFHFPLAYSIPI